MFRLWKKMLDLRKDKELVVLRWGQFQDSRDRSWA